MKNENKCFFSISLENGIVITSNGPITVKNFLTELTVLCYDSLDLKENKKHPGWLDRVRELKSSFENASETIYNNLHKKDTKK